MVLSPEHALVAELTTPAQRAAVAAYQDAGAAQERSRAHGSRQGEDRRVHGRDRDQPGQRQADPDLDRRLRAGELRHRRDHGGARRTTSATSRSRRSSASRSSRSCAPADGVGDRSGRRRSRATASTSTRGRSTACRRPRRSRRSPPSWRRAASARARSATACATGCSRASATGASRSRSSTARTTASCRCPRRSCRCACPTSSATSRPARASRRWRRSTAS